MKRMQLTDEEVSIVEDFRRKTAVVKAFNEGVDTCIAVVNSYGNDKTCQELVTAMQNARRPEKK